MKIEVEYEDIERLKSRIKLLEGENENLREGVGKFDEKNINQTIHLAAEKMARAVLKRIFDGMEIDAPPEHMMAFRFLDAANWLGDGWPESEKLVTSVSIDLEKSVKRWYLTLSKLRKAD